MLSGRKVSCWFYIGKLKIYWKHYEVWKQCAWIGLRQIDLTNEQTICTHRNKLETFEDALWKRQDFNTYNWKPCTLDLSPHGKRNAVYVKVGPSLNSFLETISTFICLFPPFQTFGNLYIWLTTNFFVHNTIQVGLPTLEPACHRVLVLTLKIDIFGQLCLFPTSKIYVYLFAVQSLSIKKEEEVLSMSKVYSTGF